MHPRHVPRLASATLMLALTLGVACGAADDEGDGIVVTTAGSAGSGQAGAGGGGGAEPTGTGGTGGSAGGAAGGGAGTAGAAGTAGGAGGAAGSSGAAGTGGAGAAGKGGAAGTGGAGAAGKAGAAGAGGAGGAGTGGTGGQMTGCLGDLQKLGVGFTLTKAKGVVDAVHITTPINGVLFANGTATKVTGDPMACEFVKTLWAFADVAKAHGFVRIGTLGSYCYRCCCAWSQTNYCRGPDDPEPDCGSNGYSNHSWGRAVDVRYLYKADGTMYDVNDNADFAKFTSTDTCGKGIQAQTGVSKELYTLVCDTGAKKVFSVILTPNYNDAHRNHFHMDIGQSGPASGFTVKSSHPDVDFDDGSPDACGSGDGP